MLRGSLKRKMLFFFSGIILLNALCFFFIWQQNSTSSSINYSEELARRNVSLVQQMTLLCFQINESDSQYYKTKLITQLDLFESSLHVMKNGGFPPQMDLSKRLPPAGSDQEAFIGEIYSNWNPFKGHLLTIAKKDKYVPAFIVTVKPDSLKNKADTIRLNRPVANASFAESLNYIEKYNEMVLASCNNLYKSYADLIDKEKAFIYWKICAVFLLDVIFCLLFYSVISRQIIQPMSKMEAATKRIVAGDYRYNVPLPDTNELVEVAQGINTLSNKLDRAREFISAIAKGELNSSYEGVSNSNDLDVNSIEGALLKMRDQMLKVSEEEKQRNWGTNGLAQIGEILRSNTDQVSDLYNNIISFVVKYLQANQGALYVIAGEESEENYIEMMACYAYDRKKFVDKRIGIKEGLIGQCIQERETVMLTNVPDEYVHITSGLGDANPNCIVIVPLKINSEIYGAIEIAGFKMFQKFQVEFLEKLAESISSTISGVKINIKTQKLLLDSQKLTEQMRNQEETMRQQMEELTATQEEMKRKEEELVRSVKELKGELNT